VVSSLRQIEDGMSHLDASISQTLMLATRASGLDESAGRRVFERFNALLTSARGAAPGLFDGFELFCPDQWTAISADGAAVRVDALRALQNDVRVILAVLRSRRRSPVAWLLSTARGQSPLAHTLAFWATVGGFALATVAAILGQK